MARIKERAKDERRRRSKEGKKIDNSLVSNDHHANVNKAAQRSIKRRNKKSSRGRQVYAILIQKHAITIPPTCCRCSLDGREEGKSRMYSVMAVCFGDECTSSMEIKLPLE
jgi:hypothetical protein